MTPPHQNIICQVISAKTLIDAKVAAAPAALPAQTAAKVADESEAAVVLLNASFAVGPVKSGPTKTKPTRRGGKKHRKKYGFRQTKAIKEEAEKAPKAEARKNEKEAKAQVCVCARTRVCVYVDQGQTLCSSV